jgi:serralysin
LTGGTGHDVFAFLGNADSTIRASDLIMDLESGDRIDLRAIDANDGAPGNQAFHIAGKFTKHAGELVLSYDAGSDRTSVSGDVDGDGRANFTILIAGDHHDFAGFVL